MNIDLSKHECEFMNKLIERLCSSKNFHGTFRFIDGLCALNDGGQFKTHTNKFHSRNMN